MKKTSFLNLRNIILKTTLAASLLFLNGLFSQAPSCPSGLIYFHTSPIQVYNPLLPISPTNPSNTAIPGGGTGLALGPNLNAPTPSPTFYTTIGGNVNWWNGTVWVNTGHTMPAVNLGTGGGALYGLNGGTGQVYTYNGTANSTLLTTVTSFGGGGPYDVSVDCMGNWSIIKCTTPGQYLNTYSPSGALLCSYSLTGMPSTSAGGGFAIVGGVVYVRNTAGLHAAAMSGTATALSFSVVSTSIVHPGDYASCPSCPVLPVLASNTGTIGCSTPSVNVIATTTASPVTYSWSGPGIMGVTNQSVAAVNLGGVYTCTVTMAGCPPLSTVVTTTVVSNGVVITPTITISNTITCAQPVATLTATPGPAGYTYTWTGPGIVSGTNSQIATVNTAGTYSIAVQSSTGTCAGTLTAVVATNTTPPAVTSTPSNTTICAGGTTGFTAAGAVSYMWNTGAITPNISVTPPVTTSYTVTGTGANGCTATAVSIASVIALPVPNITSNTPVCIGNALNLGATGGTTYSWSGPNSFSSIIQNPSIPIVTALAQGIYTLTATSGICVGTTTANIIINPLPTPVANVTTPVCEGLSANFTGSGGLFYAWAGPASFSSNSQNPGILVAGLSHNGTFTLTVTDANGCINKTTTNLVVNAIPFITTVGSTVCTNQSVNLSANGGTSYSWSGPGGFTSTSQNPTLPNANTSMAGVYSVTVTNANGCVNSSMASVIVNPLPVPTASNNGPICVNQILSLSGTGGLTYAWQGPNGFFAIAQNPTVTANTSLMSGAYTVTATDNIGCFGTAITNIMVNALPTGAITSSPNKGCVPLCVTFTCSSSAGATFNWQFGDGVSGAGINTGQCYRIAGDYTVTAGITDANGCFNTTTYNVNAYPIPVADFNYAPIKPIENDEVSFTDASYAASIAAWNWYFTNTATNTSNIQNPHFVYTDAGVYAIALVVKSDKGCVDTIVKSILVGEDYGIFVPNAFTPNADGLNDVFFAKGYGITKYEMQIFDRWGTAIFTSNQINEAWDGTYQVKAGAKTIEEGIYSWRIKLTNVFGKSHELTGHVTLIK